MRIKVRSDDTRFNLWLPTRLFVNPLSAAICTLAVNCKFGKRYYSEFIPSEGEKLSFVATYKLFRAIRKSRRLLKGQPLVEVHSADGEIVEIWV